MFSYFQKRSFFGILSSWLLPPEVNWQLTLSSNSYLTQNQILSYQPKIKLLDFDHDERALDFVWVCADYHDPQVNELLRRGKLTGEWKIAQTLASIIQNQYLTNAQHNLDDRVKFPPLPKPDLITWIPSDKQRLLVRGYHLPQKIAYFLSKKLGLISLDLVFKTKSTVSQTALSREDRLKNLTNCFDLKNNTLELNSTEVLWLIDDLTTTGTTIYEVAKIIHQKFPFIKIVAIVIAGN